jgi:hypothetical protein
VRLTIFRSKKGRIGRLPSFVSSLTLPRDLFGSYRALAAAAFPVQVILYVWPSLRRRLILTMSTGYSHFLILFLNIAYPFHH